MFVNVDFFCINLNILECGNGMFEETEECDDANLQNGDGCS